MKTRFERARLMIDAHDPAGMFQPQEINAIAASVERFVLDEIDAERARWDMRVLLATERMADALERMAR